MQVCICIATCKRPQLLEQLLNNLGRLTFQRQSEPQIRIVIVDNDAAGSAESTAKAASLPFPINYVIEPERGIAKARNRCLGLTGDADFIALIDDDEMPDPGWLDELLWAQVEFTADVVSGPVLPIFPENIPAWIRHGGFFTRPEHKTGEILQCCASNNTLIARRVLDKLPTFDETFKLTGAEDTHYFMRAYRSGFKIVATQLAIVSETIGRDRANFSDILLRAFRGGTVYVLVERSLDSRPTRTLSRLIKGCLRIAVGFFRVAISVVRGKIHAVHALRSVARGLGMVFGVAGYYPQPYQTIKGSSA